MKVLSLKDTALKLIWGGYIALLVLLLGLDFYFLEAQRENNKRKQTDVLEQYVRETEEAMGKMRRCLYDICTKDENFLALAGGLPKEDEYGNVYDLFRTLESQISVEENLQGFYLFSGGSDVPVYKVDIAQIPAEHASRIGKALKMNAASEIPEKFSGWFPLSIENHVYLVMSYKKGRAVLYGIRNIGTFPSYISEEISVDAKAIIVSDEMTGLDQGMAEQLGIRETLPDVGHNINYEENGYFVYGKRISDTNVWLIEAIPSNFHANISYQQILLFVLTLFSVVVIFAMMSFVNRNLVRPLEKMRLEMDRIREGVSENVPEMNLRFLELREVNETLTEMISQLEKQKLLTYEAVIDKQRSQMQYLQLQIQPHFYLNGLKAINALALEGQTEAVQNLIINLSEHMRYLMQAEREVTTLCKEIQFTKNYIGLQNQMTGRKIQAEFETEDGLESWKVPTLMIQTFVENSVKYARLGGINGILKIGIKVSMLNMEEENYLDLQVNDNGQGYPEEILADINGEPHVGERHVGINNLKRRCQILYGGKAEFSFYNMDGAVSEIVIPERGEENEYTVGG